MQQAATRLSTVSEGLSQQIDQLKEREKIDMLPKRVTALKQSLARLEDEKNRCTTAAETLLRRFGPLRDLGIQHFTPLLLKTVSKFEAAFEDLIDEEGEEGLTMVPSRGANSWHVLLCRRAGTRGCAAPASDCVWFERVTGRLALCAKRLTPRAGI